MAYACTAAGWADLPLDLLDGVIARLGFPGDRVRFAAVCREWRSAARELVSYFPWIVLPNGTFCTAVPGADFRMPGFPGDTTCLGAAHDRWLALDRTDDVVRRTPAGVHVVYARSDVKHKHAYTLHNPFSNVTVPLPELDAAIGHVAETFRVHKTLMRTPAPDDVIAVTTNDRSCNVILCRPGKGMFVLPYLRVVDVAFVGDTLYGITSGEELLAFQLGEDEDGRPNVTRIELVIKNPLAKYYYQDDWFWPQEVVDTCEEGVGQDDHNNDLDDNCEEEQPNNLKKNYNNEDEEDHEEEDINENLDDDELEEQALLEDNFNSDGTISDNEMFDGYGDGEVFDRFAQEEPYEAKDELYMGRYLVRSGSEELLLVRHQLQSCPHSHPYTRKVEVFKADFSAGKWTPASNRQTKGEAIFLSQSYSKCTRAYGDIHESFVYCGAHLDDVFDMTSCTIHDITLGWPCQCKLEKIIWLFPPELVG